MANLTTAATLGGLPFHGWRGWLPSLQDHLETFFRIGQSGSGSQITHTGSAETACSAWFMCPSKTDAIRVVGAVELLQGTTVQLVDPWSRSMARVRVKDAGAVIRTGRGVVITGTTVATHTVECSFTLERLP